MDYDVFKPPKSDVTLHQTVESDFYVVSPQKFLLLSVLTTGMYLVYWFYKNWKNQMLSTGERMHPVVRTIFSIFFTYSLFKRIDTKLKANNKEKEGKKEYAWFPMGMAILYIVSTLISTFITTFDDRITLPMLLSLLFTTFSVYAIYKAQLAINIGNNDPQGIANSATTGANIIWLVVGGLLWLLILLEMYADTFGMPIYMMIYDRMI